MQVPDDGSRAVQRRPHLLRSAIVSLLAIIGVVGFVLAFALPGPSDNPSQPIAVESVTPRDGVHLRQTTIMADLAPGFTGYLLMDGIEVPEDDLQRVDALNQVILRPTEDSDYKELAPGRHCAAIVYREIGKPRDQSSTYYWCFDLS